VELGADEINIDYMCNRDFRLLSALRQAVPCELSLLANDLCLYQCPYRQYHYNLVGHAGQEGHPLGGEYFDFCQVSCTTEMLSRPEQLIRARWIRPEDLRHYERLGFAKFKLSGRQMPTAWIARMVRAYAARSHRGNLGEILSGATTSPGRDLRFHIANDQLDGFLEHFRTRDCARDCTACDYCKTVAARAVSIPDQNTARCIRAYEHALDNLASSSLFQELSRSRNGGD
jgi:collagenase-like PrtC family protease